MPGSCMSVTSTPPQEWTKGDDTTPAVPVNGAITTKITRATVATIRSALLPKVASQSWAVGRGTGGHHSKGQLVVEPLIWSMADLRISDRPATPYHRADPPSPTPDTAKPKP
jgi:hypothetical protein